MEYLLLIFIAVNIINAKCEHRNINNKIDQICNITCPQGNGEMKCGFEPETQNYKMFSSQCAMNSYADCHNISFIETPIKFCIQYLLKPIRRVYGESCPVFCPTHYRPVCGASQIRSYKYRTFNNGCYLDMLNCRGDEDDGYVEVPLNFCQRHLMKNIFKEQVIVSRNEDYKEYQDY